MNTLTGMDRSILSDMHKDAYGFRPSLEFWNKVERMNDAQVEALFVELQGSVESSINEEAVRELRAQESLEKEIRINLDLGAMNRSDAIRWMVQAWDLNAKVDQDVEHFLWRKGIAQQFWPQYMTEMGFRMEGQFGFWVKEVA